MKDRERNNNGRYKNIHGKGNTRLYSIWCGMKSRCANKNLKYYGGKGIKVCNQWLNSFETFYDWAIDNGYRENLTIDRIDNNGNYEPSNCRWADNKQQSINRTSNIFYEYKGKRLSIIEWAELYNIPYKLLHQRLRTYKWDIDKALNTGIYESPLSSKLSIKDKKEIFLKYTNGISMKSLAEEYDVHKDTIAYSIRKYKFGGQTK